MMTAGTITLVVALLLNAAAVVLVGILISRSNNKILKSIGVVHRATNSMKDELVTEVRTSSLAKGRADAESEAKGRGDVRGKG